MMKQMMKPMRRRTILRGFGASLALPFLESLAWANHGKVATPAPIRYGTLLFANGVNLDEWWARVRERIELSKTLSPSMIFVVSFPTCVDSTPTTTLPAPTLHCSPIS